MHLDLLAIDWFFLLEKSILITGIIAISLVIAMYETYAERKVAAVMQDRSGPNRAGPFGILATTGRWIEIIHERRDHSEYFQQILIYLGSLPGNDHSYDDMQLFPGVINFTLFGRTIYQPADCGYQYWYTLRFWCGEYGCIWNHDRRLGIE